MKETKLQGTLIEPKNWTVILHFNRGFTEVKENLTKKEANEIVQITVFNNVDCVNCSVFRKDR